MLAVMRRTPSQQKKTHTHQDTLHLCIRAPRGDMCLCMCVLDASFDSSLASNWWEGWTRQTHSPTLRHTHYVCVCVRVNAHAGVQKCLQTLQKRSLCCCWYARPYRVRAHVSLHMFCVVVVVRRRRTKGGGAGRSMLCGCLVVGLCIDLH